jgi:hypothetical protein
MPGDDFHSAAEQARAIEKSAQPYTGFKGKVEFEKVLDLEPVEFADYTYGDLVNLYERADKIIKTSAGMGMYGAPAAGAKAAATPAAKKEMKARTEEVESRVKALTTEALTGAEKIGKEMETPIKAGKPAEAAQSSNEIELERLVTPPLELEREFAAQKEEKPPQRPAEIDFEALGEKKETEQPFEMERETEPEPQKEPEREAEKEQEKEPERQPERELEIEKPEERAPQRQPEARRPREAPTEREIPQEREMPPEREVPEAPAPRPVAQRPIERAPPAPPVPPILRERAEQAASRKYTEIEQQIAASLGQEVDEASLKKRMLSLTKELFKEKSLNRREQIKLEITVLKDMLARKARPAGKGMAEKEVRGRLLDTLVSTQKTELADAKDKILSNYKAQMDTMRQKFQDAAGSLPDGDQAGRKAEFDKLTFQLTSLMEQLPGAVSKYQDYVTQKHESEIRKLKSSLGPGDEQLVKDADARLKTIDDDYAKEFSAVRAIMKKQIDAAIEASSRVAFGKEGVPAKEAKVQDLVAEINEMDDGTLLYMLHGKDPEFYKRYERKHVSRQEAIFRAKELAAREKGLSDAMVRKYFTETEG